MAIVVTSLGPSSYAVAKRIHRDVLFRQWDFLKNGAYDIRTYLVPDKIITLGPRIEGTAIDLEYRLNLRQNWWQRRETAFCALNEIRTVVGHIKVGLSKYPDRENDLAIVKWNVEHGENMGGATYPVTFKASVALFQHPDWIYSTDIDRTLQAANR